jgi:hypothetical protein
MGASAFVVEELASRIASKHVAGSDESRVTPIYNKETQECDGLLVESSLERIMVFGREGALSLSDVSHMRRVMGRVQARRALLYVPSDMFIANPITLLATLSKIQVVRLTDLGLTH